MALDPSRPGRPNDPFVRLERSHRRLEEACDALSTAASEHDIDGVTDICGFFTRQVRRHEEDEERSLFPRLEGATAEVRATIALLSREHIEHEALHARLERAISGRSEEPQDLWVEVAAIADELTRAYRAHIDVEEKQLFSAARQLLSPSVLEEMIAEMDARRGRAA